MSRRKKIPLQTKTDILIEAGYRCGNPACSIVLTPDILEDHHIHSVSDGGGNETSNLLALCPVCHSLYTHGKISMDAIVHWKGMLTALNHAYSREAMDLLMFMSLMEFTHPTGVCVTMDGLTRFAGLANARLVNVAMHPLTPTEWQHVDFCLAYKANRDNLLQEAPDADLSIPDDLVRDVLDNPNWYRPQLYRVKLTERGRMLIHAWQSGDAVQYKTMLQHPMDSVDEDDGEAP